MNPKQVSTEADSPSAYGLVVLGNATLQLSIFPKAFW
jgi:hypothetical protein